MDSAVLLLQETAAVLRCKGTSQKLGLWLSLKLSFELLHDNGFTAVGWQDEQIKSWEFLDSCTSGRRCK